MPRYKRVRTNRRHNAEAGVNLRLRRRWFDGDDDGDDPQGKIPDGDNSSSGHDKTALEDMTAEELILIVRQTRGEAKKSRIKRRNLEKELNDTKGQMSTVEKLRKQELEAEGNWKKLSDEQAIELARLGEIEAKAERLEASVIARNAKLVEKLPENMRDLYPSELSPEDQSAWLDKAVPKLKAMPPPNLDGGAGGQGRGGQSNVKLTSDEKNLAAAMRMTDEQYIAAKK